MEVLYKVSEFEDLKPVKYEVLPNEDCISDRYYRLKKGLIYGRFNLMTKMVVMTEDGEKSIKSIVLELTDKTIKIKGKVDIPINIIKAVDYIY